MSRFGKLGSSRSIEGSSLILGGDSYLLGGYDVFQS